MSKLSALVVDDSKSARFFLRKALEEQDVDVALVESGFDAIAYVGNQRPDIVFMDHQMPEMDGLETMSRMKQDPSSAAIPVVMCTSTDDSAFLNRVDQVGGLGILPKPPSPEGLRGVLNQVRRRIADSQRQAAAMEAMRVEMEEGLRAEIRSQIAAMQESLGRTGIDEKANGWQEPLAELEGRLREHVASELDAKISRLKAEIPEPDESRIADLAGATILGGEALSEKMQGLLDAGISAAEEKRSSDIDTTVTRALSAVEERISKNHASALEEGLAGLRSEISPPDEAALVEQVRGAMLADDSFLDKLRELVAPAPVEQEEAPDVNAMVAEGVGAAMNAVDEKISTRVSGEVGNALNQFREEHPPLDETAMVEMVKSALAADQSFMSSVRDAVTPEPESEDVLVERAAESESLMAEKVEKAVGALGERVPGMISEDLDGRMEALREELKPPLAEDIAGQVRADVRNDASLVDEILDRIPEASERWQRRMKGLTSQVRQAMLLQLAFAGGMAAAIAFAVSYFF